MKQTVVKTSDVFLHWLKVFRVIVVRFIKDGFTYRASALTYTTLLALVPLMAVLFSVLSAFPVFKNVGDQIQGYAFEHFVPATGKVVEGYLTTFAAQASKLSGIGIALLIITAVMLLLTIERSFNEVWRVKVGRKGVVAFLTYWAIITLGPIFIGLSFIISSYVFSLRILSEVSQHALVLNLLPFILIVIGFTVLNVIVPNCRVKFRYALLGGFISAIFFEIARRLFALYALHFQSYHLIYGALAAIPLFLIWVYVCWLIILLGALISHTVATEQKDYKGPVINEFLQAYLIISLVWKGHQNGGGYSLKKINKLLPGNYHQSMEYMLAELRRLKLIQKTEEGLYVINQSCDHLTLRELTDRLPWPLPKFDEISKHKHDEFKGLKGVLKKLEGFEGPVLELTLSSLLA